jgi:hypothetical protein
VALLVLLNRVEREAEAPGELRLAQPQPFAQRPNLLGRERRIHGLRLRQFLLGPRIAVLDRLRLDLRLAGSRPRRELGQQLERIDVSPGASHDRDPAPSGSRKVEGEGANLRFRRIYCPCLNAKQ